jgi:hypothetical protein
MKMSCRALSLLALAVGIACCNGCNQANNEENLGGSRSEYVPHKEGDPDYKDYGDMMQKKTAAAAANRASEKGTPATKKK